MSTDYPFFFTWTAQNAAKPIELTGGDRAWFTTADGGRWLDLGSLAYQVNAGHGRQRIVERKVAIGLVASEEKPQPDGESRDQARHRKFTPPRLFTAIFPTNLL